MKNNIWLWFYKYYKKYDEVPSTICPLFWGGLLGLIFWFLAPFTNLILYIAMIVDNQGYDKDLRSSFIEFKSDAGVAGVTMVVLNFAIIMGYLMGSIILEVIFGLDFKVEHPTWVYFASIFVIPISAAI
ncbi:MAG: hypothetical protein KUG64_10480, partial [Cycloclasticus sp.]|nr:hypothetical protein [Cycloclasticus sp.]